MLAKACGNPARQGTVDPATPTAGYPGRSDLRSPVSQPVEPLSLERARLLLIWLQAQRTVDSCLSELLAAGPAGEQRVRADIDRVSELVEATAEAFAAYRESVLSAEADQQGPDGAPSYERPALASVPALPRDAADIDSALNARPTG
jgi:hypothetical protein